MLLTLTTAANPVFKLSADYYPPSSSYRNPLNIDPRLRLIGGSCFDGMASLLVEVPAATEYDYFDIYRALFPAGPYERIGNTQGAYYPPTSFLDHSVENDRIYYYKAGLVNENQTLDTSDYTVVIPSKIHHLLPSPLSGFSPVIDGRLDSAEWHDAQQLVITNHMGVNGFMPDSQVYLYLKNDNNFLYMGIEDFNDDLSLWSEIGIYLDYNHDKSWPVDSGGHEGNFYLKYNRGRAKVSFRPLFGQLPNVYSASIDTLVEGIEFAASAPKGHAHWEVKVSLNDGYFIAKEGDTLGIRLYVLEKNSNLNACFPAAAIWIDPRTYGDLIVSSPFNAIPAPAFAPYPHHSSIIYHDSVKLAWSGFDRQGDQLYYDLLWGETSPPNQLLSHLQTDSSFSIAGLVYDRFYYWQINSYDQQYITPGPIWQFRVEQEPNTAPSAAWGPDPSDGATEVSPGSGLSWRSSADIDGDRVYYDLYLGAGELPSVATVRDWGDTLWTPPSALSWSTLYRWRVVSRDGRGGEMVSDIWSFTVASVPNTAPSAAWGPDPSDGATEVSPGSGLSWRSSADIDGDRVYYDLYLGAGELPSVATVRDWVDTLWTPPSALSWSTLYRWRVVSRDGRGGETSSDIWSFTVASVPNTAPSAAWGPDPSDGATEVSPGSGLSWRSSADIDGDRVYYDLYLGAVELPSVATVRDWGDTLWTPPSALSWSTLYRWRVVSRDGRGGEMASDIWSFTIRDTIRDPVEEDSECFAHPIPFTPNDDGINDRVFFKYPADRNGASVKIFIFDMFNHKIKEIKQADFWDGRDDNGKKMNSNPYYYLLELDGKIVCKGLIYIAR